MNVARVNLHRSETGNYRPIKNRHRRGAFAGCADTFASARRGGPELGQGGFMIRAHASNPSNLRPCKGRGCRQVLRRLVVGKSLATAALAFAAGPDLGRTRQSVHDGKFQKACELLLPFEKSALGDAACGDMRCQGQPCRWQPCPAPPTSPRRGNCPRSPCPACRSPGCGWPPARLPGSTAMQCPLVRRGRRGCGRHRRAHARRAK